MYQAGRRLAAIEEAGVPPRPSETEQHTSPTVQLADAYI